MSTYCQQSLKEAIGARKSATVENDNVCSDSELRLSGSDSNITDPDVNHTPEAPEVANQPSGATDSSAYHAW